MIRYTEYTIIQQKSRAVTRKTRDAPAVLFFLKFAYNIRYKFKSKKPSFEGHA